MTFRKSCLLEHWPFALNWQGFKTYRSIHSEPLLRQQVLDAPEDIAMWKDLLKSGQHHQRGLEALRNNELSARDKDMMRKRKMAQKNRCVFWHACALS